MKLLHRTTIERAELIDRCGFTDGVYDSFGRGVMGVYFCTMDKPEHALGNQALIVVEIPEDQLLAEWSDPCPPDAVDWRIPAAVVNNYPRTRLND